MCRCVARGTQDALDYRGHSRGRTVRKRAVARTDGNSDGDKHGTSGHANGHSHLDRQPPTGRGVELDYGYGNNANNLGIHYAHRRHKRGGLTGSAEIHQRADCRHRARMRRCRGVWDFARATRQMHPKEEVR